MGTGYPFDRAKINLRAGSILGSLAEAGSQGQH